MFKNKWIHLTIGGIFYIFTANIASAHANFVPKDNIDSYSGREYQEGSSAYLSLSIAHGCNSMDGSKSYKTKHVVAIFPNDVNMQGIAYTKDRSGNHYGANGIMSIRPQTDSNWRFISNPKATVNEYYSHGVKTEDVSAIQWIGGDIPSDFFAGLTLRAQFPYLEECVSKLRVYIPTIQYCAAGHIKGWLRSPTHSMPEHLISPGYAPYIDVIRAENNPIDPTCTKAIEEEAYPSDERIEKSLLRWRQAL